MIVATRTTASSTSAGGLGGAAIAVTAWAAGSVLAKVVDLGGLAIAAYRFGFFSVLIVAWMAARRTPITVRVMRESALGGVMLAADVALFFSGLKLTSVVNATIIGSLQPIVVGFVAYRFFGERIRPRDVLWSAVGLAAVLLVVTSGASSANNSIRGDLLAAGGTLAWSAYFIFSKQSRTRMTPLEFTAGSAIWTTVLTIPLGFLFGQDMSMPVGRNLWLMVVMTVLSGVIGHVLMNWSLVRIPLWIGSTFTLLIPVASTLLAWWWLSESITVMQGVGIVMVVVALAMVVRGQTTPGEDET